VWGTPGGVPQAVRSPLAVPRSLRLALVSALIVVHAFAQVETTPPPPAAPRPVGVPQAAETTLANGLRVIVIPKHNVPLVSARLLIRTGAASDPAQRAGLADMTASLLTKGTATRSAQQIAEGIESLGGSLDSGAGWDVSSVSTSVMSSKLSRALGFVADVVRHPRFSTKELDRLRDQSIDALQVDLREPRALRNMVTARVVFGGTPYGHVRGGTVASLKRLTRADVVAFHRDFYHPANAILVIGGDVDGKTAFALAKRWLGDWDNGGRTKFPLPPPAPRQPMGMVYVVDMPDAGQAAVAIARAGIRRNNDWEYHASEVANMVLGGDYSSRLNEEIRIKRGLSYGAYSTFDSRRDAGPFIASALTKNESAAEVASLMLEQLALMAKESVPAAELTARKANLIGTFSRSLETNDALVSRIGDLALYGLPLEEVRHYPGEIEGVSAEKVLAFSAVHFAGGADVIIVGDVKKFGADLKKRFPAARVIPIDKLDLDAPQLQKALSP
jgi:zinc protease